MKKILMNAAIATGLALFAGNAFAGDDNAFPSSIGFEGNNQGMLNLWGDDGRGDDNTYWNTSGDVESTFVTNYTDTAVTPPAADNRPDFFAGAANNNFLKIDSPNGFERYMQLGGEAQSLESDVFVDMNVQFTVSDTVLDLGTNTDNDKLAIWLYAPDTDGAETNLVITAGVLSESLEPTVTNFVVDNEDLAVEPDTWYRLTVKTTLGSDSVPRFKVYVNGNLVSATAALSSDGEIVATSEVDTFASLVQYDKDGAQTLSSVTFQGVGALDDLAFTTTKPGFIPAEVKPFAIDGEEFATLAEAIEAAEADDVITMQANYTIGAEEIVSVGRSIVLDLNGKALVGNVTVVQNGGLVVTNGSEAAASVSGNVVYLGSLIVDSDITIATVSGSGVLKAKVTDNLTLDNAMEGEWSANPDEDGYYVYELSAGEDTYTFAVEGSNITVTYMFGFIEEGEFVPTDESATAYDDPVEVYEADVLKVVIEPAENYTITSVTGTNVEPTVVDGVYTYVIEIGTADVTLMVQTSAAGGDDPVLDPAEGTIEVTVKAETKTAAETKAKEAIAVPNGATVDKAVYAEYFTYSAEAAGEGSFTVTITGIKEEIEADVLESAVERLTDDEATTITVPAGLYYSITPSTVLPISGEAVKGLSTGGTVSVGKPGTAAGFYEIKLSPTEIK